MAYILLYDHSYDKTILKKSIKTFDNTIIYICSPTNEIIGVL